jgi:hypothetical protein
MRKYETYGSLGFAAAAWHMLDELAIRFRLASMDAVFYGDSNKS